MGHRTFYHRVVLESGYGATKQIVLVKCVIGASNHTRLHKRNVLPAGFQEPEVTGRSTIVWCWSQDMERPNRLCWLNALLGPPIIPVFTREMFSPRDSKSQSEYY
uniref:Uncharacterized protein n=1 Tax=Timema bartmani TaxID=61472 RepID=A0A7R9F1G5_9NEOP|nr:unnamed protein product [Timema bartmani]